LSHRAALQRRIDELTAEVERLRAKVEAAETALCDGLLGGKGTPLGNDPDSCILAVAYAESVLKALRGGRR
jgi:hypothetical protein